MEGCSVPRFFSTKLVIKALQQALYLILFSRDTQQKNIMVKLTPTVGAIGGPKVPPSNDGFSPKANDIIDYYRFGPNHGSGPFIDPRTK